MVVPIVFLPGIMGSRLRFTDSGLFWDPDSNLRMLRWLPVPLINPAADLARKLHRDAPAEVMEDDSNDLSEEEVALGWAGVSSKYYLEFLTFLRDNTGSPVHAVGYDWRQDLVSLVPYLREKVDTIRGAGKVILITHSMGGLLARAALAQDAALAAQVAGVIHICQPALGAVLLYRRCLTGVRLGLDVDLTSLPFAWVLGDTPTAFVTNVCGLPGALQLLPTPDYQFPAGSHWYPFAEPADLYDLYAFGQSPPGITPADASEFVLANLPERWPEVRAFQALTRGFRHPNTWAIFGTGRDTDVAVALDDSGDLTTDQRALGDSTVPIRSGAALFDSSGVLDGSDLDTNAFRQWQVEGVEHSMACSDETVQQAVIQIVARING
jgi:hypothetical protein